MQMGLPFTPSDLYLLACGKLPKRSKSPLFCFSSLSSEKKNSSINIPDAAVVSNKGSTWLPRSCHGVGWGRVEGKEPSWTGFSFLAPLAAAPGSSNPCFFSGWTLLLTALCLTKTLSCPSSPPCSGASSSLAGTGAMGRAGSGLGSSLGWAIIERGAGKLQGGHPQEGSEGCDPPALCTPCCGHQLPPCPCWGGTRLSLCPSQGLCPQPPSSCHASAHLLL